MEPRETRLIGELWRAGMVRLPRLTFRNGEPEQPSEVRASRSILNCDARAFGIVASRVAPKVPFQPAARVLLRRGLQV